MKNFGLTSIAVAALILAITSTAYARQERPTENQEHPEQQQSKQEQGKSQQQHAQQKPQPTEHAQQQKPSEQKIQQQQQVQHVQQHKASEQNKQQQAQHAQQQKVSEQNKQQATASAQRAPHQQHAQEAAFQQRRTESWQSAHRTWEQRGGYNGYRIPDDRFNGHFGENHDFRIYGLPFQTVGGYPRFQYQGYWLSLVDPWPSSWAANWYNTDDVYVSYDNGYYLYDRRYPGVGLAISISN